MTETTLLTFRPQLRSFTDADELRQTCDETLRETEARIRILSGLESADLLAAWDDLEILIEDIFGPVSLYAEVHPDRDVRQAADEKLVELTKLTTRMFQDEALFEAVMRVEPATGPESKLRQDLIEEFEDNGVHLPPEKRERVREIVAEISELSQEFSRNIRDADQKVAFEVEELEGAPARFLASLERDGSRLLVGLDYPEYHPFMNTVRSAEARERLFRAYHRRGGERNLEILGRVTRLRSELAELYAMPSFAEMIIRRKMARTPGRVHEMLRAVHEAVSTREELDLESLREEKLALEGPDSDGVVRRWDVQFLLERLRENRFSIDQEALRRYFPTEPVTRWILELSSRLYGIRFERADAEVWHEEVEAHHLFDRESDEFIGTVYLDLFPRDGKYKHAAAWPVRGVSRRANRTPISVLVTNFDREGLTQSEVETYLHEFGHVLHGVLSSTWFNRHSGTSVERDFVEAPSQMFEWWARRMESLRVLAEVSPGSPPIDDSLVARLDAARRFGKGIHYARQHLYAAYDMELAEGRSDDIFATWKAMEGETKLGHVDGTIFPASFAHLTGGYAAGYYGYLWSEAIATDLLSAWGDDLMDEGPGRRFREEILGRGSEISAETMVERFLGRPTSAEEFARELKGES